MSLDSSKLASEHDRYLVQASWTAALRSTILDQISLPIPADVLEVGSGTGAITQSIQMEIDAWVTGVDSDPDAVKFATQSGAPVHYAMADGHHLPFPGGSFDLAYSHFLLLWVRDPAEVLREMARTVKPGGWVVAFAEPDYGARIDYPPSLEEIGALQRRALKHSGAQPDIGRTLRSLFSSTGFSEITAGVLGGEWGTGNDGDLARSEWSTLMADLQGELPAEQLERLRQADASAWQERSRILYVPTFYAFGKVALD